MANPQADKFTRLSNELYGAIMQSDFSKRQRNIIDMIIRFSYGCNKKTALLRHSDFEQCGVGRNKIKSELEYLDKVKVIFRDGDMIQLNKNYDQWRVNLIKSFDQNKFNEILNRNLIVPKTGTITQPEAVPKTGTIEDESSQNGNPTVPKTGTDTGLETNDTKEFQPSKDSIKDINNNKLINNNESDSFLEDLEAEHASKQSLIDEIESYYRAKKCEDPNKPTSNKDFRLIVDAVDKYSREEIINGINHAFLTAEDVYSFKYCLDCIVTQKEYREKQRQHKQKKVVPFKNPASQLPESIRKAQEEQNQQTEVENQMTPEEFEQFKKDFAEFNRKAEEMRIGS